MVNKTILQNHTRYDVMKSLDSNSIGLELGIAEGIYSEQAIKSGKFKTYIGIDMYDGQRTHDIAQYKRALKRVGLFGNYKLLKMRFDEALDLFDDETFDFIYVDGYAHTGEEEGKTLYDWWPKLKKGGLYCGDDYHERQWPLVYKYVNEFCEKNNISELLITDTTGKDPYSKFPTWMIRK